MTGALAISARDLGKRYRRGAEQVRHNSLRDAVQHGLGSMFQGGLDRNRNEDFWALKGARFDIAHGENVGIIGLNGAGKSTLLKLLSRITAPTTGTARIEGRLGALLEVGTGFHQELTGRENVFLYGAILGMTREEIIRKFDAIVGFSEIGKFIDTPVKRYSSGMYVRLAFAVAAHLDPDILLLDEVLAVGDFSFQRKCIALTRELQQKGATILFVSHNMFSIKAMCPRVIYLKAGRVVFDGATDEGLSLYENDSRLANTSWFKDAPARTSITIRNVRLRGEDGRPRSVFHFGERMRVSVDYEAHEPLEEPQFLVSFTRSDEILCCNFSTVADGVPLPRVDGEGTIEVLTPPLKLVAEMYTVSIVVRQRGFGPVLCAQIGASFHVNHSLFSTNAFGIFHEAGQWSHEAAPAALPESLRA